MMQTQPPRTFHRQILRSLLAREYLSHRTMAARFLSAWVILVVIIPIISDARTVTIFGLILAVHFGTSLGGSDLIGGYEESVFTSPPTAGWRYLVRSLTGLALLLILLLGSSLVISAHVPQLAWGLIVDSGLTTYPEMTGWDSWWTIIACCSALYATTFAIAAATSSATLARSASIAAGGLLLALSIVNHLYLDRWSSSGAEAYDLNVMLCTLAGLMALPLGFLVYRRKQVSSQLPAQASLTWLVAVIIILVVFLLLGTCSLDR